MGTIILSNIVFVDSVYGLDSTGRLNSLQFKFKTFDAAYQKIEELGKFRPSYIISLSDGNFEMNLPFYENISVESTNDRDGILSNIIIPSKEVQWNGLIFNQDRLSIDVDPIEIRDPIFIVGASSIESTCEIHMDNFSKTNILINKSEKNKHKYQNKEIDPSLGKIIFSSISFFKAAVRPLLFSSIETLMIFIGSSNIVIKGLPTEYNGTDEDDEAIIQYIDVLLDELAAVVFQGSIDEKSVLYYAFDMLLTAFQTKSESEIEGGRGLGKGKGRGNETKSTINHINKRRLENNNQIPVILNNINLSINKTTDQITQDNFLYKEKSNFNINTITPKTSFVITPNQITEFLDKQLLNEYMNAQQSILNKLGNINDIPKVAITDCNINYSGNHFCVTDNVNEYFIDNSNISGIELNENNDYNLIYPVLNINEKEGANINKGSKFLRYRCITTDYTHNRLDGEFFFIDASQQDIEIIIPKLDDNDHNRWVGRNIEYKRIDKSNNNVVVINKQGNINDYGNKLKLDNCINRIKLPDTKLFIMKNGNIYTC